VWGHPQIRPLRGQPLPSRRRRRGDPPSPPSVGQGHKPLDQEGRWRRSSTEEPAAQQPGGRRCADAAHFGVDGGERCPIQQRASVFRRPLPLWGAISGGRGRRAASPVSHVSDEVGTPPRTTVAAINSFLIDAVAYRFAAPEGAWVSVVGTRAKFIMDHLEKDATLRAGDLRGVDRRPHRHWNADGRFTLAALDFCRARRLASAAYDRD